jgi:hypothetical protein
MKYTILITGLAHGWGSSSGSDYHSGGSSSAFSGWGDHSGGDSGWGSHVGVDESLSLAYCPPAMCVTKFNAIQFIICTY